MGFTYRYEQGSGVVINPGKNATYLRVIDTKCSTRTFPWATTTFEMLRGKTASLKTIIEGEEIPLLKDVNLIAFQTAPTDVRLTFNAPRDIEINATRSKEKNPRFSKEELDAKLEGYFPLALPKRTYQSNPSLRLCENPTQSEYISLGQDVKLRLAGIHHHSTSEYGKAVGMIRLVLNQASRAIPILSGAHVSCFPKLGVGIDCLQIDRKTATFGIYSLPNSP